jgi:hypothetical protein
LNSKIKNWFFFFCLLILMKNYTHSWAEPASGVPLQISDIPTPDYLARSMIKSITIPAFPPLFQHAQTVCTVSIPDITKHKVESSRIGMSAGAGPIISITDGKESRSHSGSRPPGPSA